MFQCDPRTFNLPRLQWHAMYLGTRVCLLSLTKRGLCDRHKKGHLQGQAPNVTTLWQRWWWIDTQVCFKWGVKGFCFSRHPWRDEEVRCLIGTLLGLLRKTRVTAACINRRALNFPRASSDIILALALFLRMDMLRELHVGSCGHQLWAAYFLNCCFWNVRRLQIFLSIRFIALITTHGMCFARCAHVLPPSKTVKHESVAVTSPPFPPP